MRDPAKFNPARVAAALEGRLSPDALTEEENAACTEAFIKLMGAPGPEEEAFFERRRRLGLGVGLDESGNLVWAGKALFRAMTVGLRLGRYKSGACNVFLGSRIPALRYQGNFPALSGHSTCHRALRFSFSRPVIRSSCSTFKE